MDPGLKSPLLDFFRRGEVASDVRLLAAQGALAPRAHEQVALLLLLTEDPDMGIRMAANRTLDRIPREPLSLFLARQDVPSEFRTFFRARGVEPASVPAPGADDPLIDTSPDQPAPPERAAGPPQHLSRLSLGERMALAMKGSRGNRAALIRDPNRLIAAAVLSSPKLTETEIEGFARMANLSEDVLRMIGTTRAWVKNYGVACGLARNPKTPLAISMGLLGRLHERDLKMLSIDRNVPEALRIAARKRVVSDGSRK